MTVLHSTALARSAALAPVLLATLVACVVDAEDEVAVDRDSDSAPFSNETAVVSAAGGQQVTIRGRVFYNDRRDHGLFAARRTPTGAVGTRCNTAGQRDDGTACSLNWLGAQYAVVDVLDLDDGYGLLDVNCHPEVVLGSVAVNYDGSFAATVSVDDACNHDDLGNAIALRVRLRYCGPWCFSLNTEEDAPYALYHPGASAASPRIVAPGADVSVGDMYFNPAGSPTTVANNTSRAASYYASLVDTILTVHRDAGVPFYKSSFGEIQYVYPSSLTATATAKSPTLVVISSTLDPGWVGGKTSAHEYGHVLMQRAWDGDYGFDGVGISANDSTIAPSRQIAFKEAWAEFIARAVFPLTYGCGLASFDDNATSPLPGALGQGAQWRLNVTKALCDWYDGRNDDDAALAGAGDHFAADGIYSMWFNLRQMYLTASLYGGDYAGEGLWFCDYVDYYLDVRQSTAAVGAASHANYVSTITDLIYNNNIACFLPAP